MNMLKERLTKLYHDTESLPERFYPFAEEIEGKLVRGRDAYKRTVEKAVAKYGPDQLGYTIQWYRATWHFFGSVLFIVSATFIARHWFGSETALYVLLGAAITALYVQEFYSHPRRLNQTRRKSVTDWLTWAIPMVLYMIFWL